MRYGGVRLELWFSIVVLFSFNRSSVGVGVGCVHTLVQYPWSPDEGVRFMKLE